MATNIRNDRVVDPLHLNEFDRRTTPPPGVWLFAGALMVLLGLSAQIALFFTGAPAASSVLVLVLALVVAGFLVRRALVSAEHMLLVQEELSRPLAPLEEVIVFDRDRVSNLGLWNATAVCAELDELDERYGTLAHALALTPQQRADLRRYEERREVLAESALTALHSGPVYQ